MISFIQQLQQLKQQNKKALAVLIDPDQSIQSVRQIAQLCQKQQSLFSQSFFTGYRPRENIDDSYLENASVRFVISLLIYIFL